MAHGTGNRRCPLGDIGQLLRSRAFVDRGVGHEYRVRLTDEHVNTEGNTTFGRVEHPANLAHRLGIGARRAGDHCIGLAHFQQERSEDVAVLVHHPLHFAPQIAASLKPLVKLVDHCRNER